MLTHSYLAKISNSLLRSFRNVNLVQEIHENRFLPIIFISMSRRIVAISPINRWSLKHVRFFYEVNRLLYHWVIVLILTNPIYIKTWSVVNFLVYIFFLLCKLQISGKFLHSKCTWKCTLGRGHDNFLLCLHAANIWLNYNYESSFVSFSFELRQRCD